MKENTKLIQRKQFLMRALSNRNIEESEYKKEIAKLEPLIQANLDKRLKAEYAKLKEESNTIKKTIISDGDYKRAIARMLIQFLKEDLTIDEIKGVMRQGYKITRSMIK